MASGTDQDVSLTGAHRVVWFAPQRPVEGATIFVRPAPAEPEAAPAPNGEVPTPPIGSTR